MIIIKRITNKLGFVVMLLILTTLANAQQKIDTKRGFNKFILGSNIKEIKAIASLQKLKGLADPEFQNWSVKDIEKYRIFDYPLRQIRLVFYKDRLLEINVYLISGDKEMFVSSEVAVKISKEYGEWNERTLSGGDEVDGLKKKYDINGERVSLIRYVYGHSEQSNRIVYIGDRYCFIDVDLYDEQMKAKGNGL
ncbi:MULTISPECIES: hypothetical protein [unclassified Pedobacter]|uniref:hypothetical protein n=1 Tax=unclassified Pedobacter TaxID=2628915 RepID=UPI001D6AF23F|nr:MULTISPECIES: hypothetical protein [unclassified Pedobacter]CAH0186189.1 hypothetical protein SRABI36_01633 [Pedobacter sp. Bi36]CAH0241955.1 hypothetical protein SRABI126_02726 [Pedobacter sp. Bi126]